MYRRPARGHHYVSRFYLEGFVSPQLESERLWQWDLKRHLVVPVSPSDAGKKRDFNLHTNPEFRPDAVETALSELEAKAAASLDHMKSTRTPLPVEHLITLLGLTALFAVRNPGWRKFLVRMTESLITNQVKRATNTPEKREQVAREMTGSGIPISAQAIEEANLAYERGDLTFSMSKNSILAREFENAQELERLFRDRNWTLVESSDDDAEFIASDAPVSLGSDWGLYRVPSLYWVGWRRKDTLVAFPLSPRLMLLGRYGGNVMTASIGRRGVAEINTRTLRNATNFVYSARNAFVVFDDEGEVRSFPPLRSAFTFERGG